MLIIIWFCTNVNNKIILLCNIFFVVEWHEIESHLQVHGFQKISGYRDRWVDWMGASWLSQLHSSNLVNTLSKTVCYLLPDHHLIFKKTISHRTPSLQFLIQFAYPSLQNCNKFLLLNIIFIYFVFLI